MQKTIVQTNGREPLKRISAYISPEIVAAPRCSKPNHCMVAQALYNAYPQAKHVWVDANTIRLTLGNVRHWFLTPISVATHVYNYDNANQLKPFRFSTDKLMRVTEGGEGAFHRSHPNGDNRTNPRKQYDPAKKKRKYGTRTRVNGVCVWR